HFTDRTRDWALPSPGYGMGAAAGDFDGDGWTDLFLTTFDGPDALLRNDHGRFVDVTAKAGITQDGRWSTSAGFLDLDGDGDLDLAVANFQGDTTSVYLQKGLRLFQEVSDAIGVGEPARRRLKFGLGFLDADNDGDEDLLVANGHIEDNVATFRK